MKRIKILKNGVVTNQAEDSSALNVDQWLAEGVAANWFGKPERWLNGFNLSDAEKAQAIETRVSAGSLGEEITEYKFAAEYEIVEENIDGEINAAIAKKERIQALRVKHAAMKPNDLDTIVELRQAIIEIQEILGLK
jgi:hypothetical protein